MRWPEVYSSSRGTLCIHMSGASRGSTGHNNTKSYRTENKTSSSSSLRISISTATALLESSCAC